MADAITRSDEAPADDSYNACREPDMAVQLTRRRFTVDEYYWMARVGILSEDDRVELIDGEIVEMSPIGPEHASAVMRLGAIFHRAFDGVAQTGIQNPVRLGQLDEPQPDLALLRPRKDWYRISHPTPEDVFLVVEVAVSSLETDRRVKAPLYCKAGIPEYWLIDLPNTRVHVYREPAADGYGVTRTFRSGECLAPLAFPDREIAVDDLLG